MAGGLNVSLSLVGGAVRDLLLGKPLATDLDLVVEGDGVAAARDAAKLLSERVRIHPRFGTAAVDLSEGEHLDFVTARRESYPHPGALPQVEASTLDDDLRRRDFTVNAIALRLNGESAGSLVDPMDGLLDLDAGVIRIHHAQSFRDDPSRIVRAARYAARLNFALDDQTSVAARNAAPDVEWGSSRVAEELKRLFEEVDPEPARVLLGSFGAPGLRDGPAEPTVGALEEALRAPNAPSVERWALAVGVGVAQEVLDGLAIPGWARAQARDASAGQRLADALLGCSSPSDADRLLAAERPATAVVAAALGAPWVTRWWVEDRDRRLDISGHDFILAGLERGPGLGVAMAAARAALLDGAAPDKATQLAAGLRAVQ